MTSSCRAMILVSYVPHVHALYKEKGKVEDVLSALLSHKTKVLAWVSR